LRLPPTAGLVRVLDPGGPGKHGSHERDSGPDLRVARGLPRRDRVFCTAIRATLWLAWLPSP